MVNLKVDLNRLKTSKKNPFFIKKINTGEKKKG